MKVWHFGDKDIIHMYVEDLDTEFFLDKDSYTWWTWSNGRYNVLPSHSMIEVNTLEEAKERVEKLYPEFLL